MRKHLALALAFASFSAAPRAFADDAGVEDAATDAGADAAEEEDAGADYGSEDAGPIVQGESGNQCAASRVPRGGVFYAVGSMILVGGALVLRRRRR